jgi:hypothetical protein
MWAEDWVTFLQCRMGNTATLGCSLGSSLGSLESWPDGHSTFSFCHWPALYVGWCRCGCHVAKTQGPLQGRWWVNPCQAGAPNSSPYRCGFPIIHKPDIPKTYIVSSIGSPCYALASFLHKTLSPLAGKSESFIKNLGLFIQLLKSVNL